MKPMNELLSDIVVAAGGTVTATTRNGLLRDWLDAVSSSSYLYQLNGVDQFIKLTPIASPEPSGVTLEFDAIANVDAAGYLAGGNESGLLTWRVGWAGGVIEKYRLGTLTIDGVDYNDDDPFVLDGETHHIVMSLGDGGFRASVSAVGALYNTSTGDVSNHSNSIIYNVSVDNSTVSGFIPLNNKDQGANQLAASGTINAEIINYDESGWVAV